MFSGKLSTLPVDSFASLLDFRSVVLSEFISWEEIPSALRFPSVTASGLHHSKPNLSESPCGEQPTFLLGAILGHLLVLSVAGSFLYGTASL